MNHQQTKERAFFLFRTLNEHKEGFVSAVYPLARTSFSRKEKERNRVAAIAREVRKIRDLPEAIALRKLQTGCPHFDRQADGDGLYWRCPTCGKQSVLDCHVKDIIRSPKMMAHHSCFPGVALLAYDDAVIFRALEEYAGQSLDVGAHAVADFS